MIRWSRRLLRHVNSAGYCTRCWTLVLRDQHTGDRCDRNRALAKVERPVPKP